MELLRTPRRSLATLDEARERLARWRGRERDLDPPLGLWAVGPAGSRHAVTTAGRLLWSGL
jgi:hypothetical protein